MKKFIFFILFFWGIVQLSNANIADTYGLGARGSAMGSAMSAIVDDWTSPYYNMAGLGRKPYAESIENLKAASTQLLYKALSKTQKKVLNGRDETSQETMNNNEMAIGYLYSIPMMDVSYDGATEVDNLNTGAIALGLVIDMNTFVRMPFDLNMRFGLCAILEDDFGLGKVSDDDPRAHYFLRYGRKIQRFLLNMGVGIEVWKDHLYIGMGSTSGVASEGAVMIERVQMTEETQSPPARTKMNLRPGQAPLAGISFKWENLGPGTFNAGLTYRGQLVLVIDPFDTEAITELGNIDMKMSLAIQDYFTPHEYVIGCAYTYPNLWIFKYITSCVDIEYQQWSKFDLSRTRKMQPDYEDPNFRDIIIYRFGVEEGIYPWLKARQGYVYRPAFTPNQTSRSNFLDNNTHIISLGLGFVIPDIIILKVPIEIDIAYQFQFLAQRESIKIDQSNPYNPNYTYGGQVHTVFFSMRWRY